MGDRSVSGENEPGSFTITDCVYRTVDDHQHVQAEGTTMTAAQSRDAVNGAALVVAGLYFYRKLLEPTIADSASAKSKSQVQPKTLPGAALQVVGVGPLASTGRFIVGFGVTFLVLSLAEGVSSDLAGYFAILIALGALLGNGSQAAEDIKYQLDERNSALNKLSAKAEPNTPTVQVASWEGMSAPRVSTKPRKV